MARSIIETTSSTSMIFCTGMLRSGSTWSFNVCRLLAQVAGRQRNQPFWAGYLTLEQCERFLSQSNGRFPGPTVVKAHGLGPLAMRHLTMEQAKAVCTFRDPRDCVASLMQFTNERFDIACARILEGLRMLDLYPQDQTLFIHYEDLLGDRLAQVRKIAAHLSISPEESLLRRIDELTSIEKSREICRDLTNRPDTQVIHSENHRVDPKTWLHHNHIQDGRSGRWRDQLTDEQVDHADQIFAPWLARWYPQAPHRTATPMHRQPISSTR
jgi:hypothetical protein